ncbi:MAG: START domain-containing protein [Pseudohongiellaceae bacterium]
MKYFQASLTDNSDFGVAKTALVMAVFLVVLLGFGVAAQGQENEWELKKDSEGIQVFTRAVPGSPYKEVRSVSRLERVSLSSLVALIEDVEACPRWADKCAESYLVERVSDRESLIYTHNDMPFPVKDRDVVAQVVWSQDPESFQVTMSSTAVAGGVDKVRGRLRLTEANALWQFTPQPDGSVEVLNQAHINPGSSIPGWVTNMLLVDTPFETMKSYLAEVVSSQYSDAQIGFIQEPK